MGLLSQLPSFIASFASPSKPVSPSAMGMSMSYILILGIPLLTILFFWYYSDSCLRKKLDNVSHNLWALNPAWWMLFYMIQALALAIGFLAVVMSLTTAYSWQGVVSVALFLCTFVILIFSVVSIVYNDRTFCWSYIIIANVLLFFFTLLWTFVAASLNSMVIILGIISLMIDLYFIILFAYMRYINLNYQNSDCIRLPIDPLTHFPIQNSINLCDIKPNYPHSSTSSRSSPSPSSSRAFSPKARKRQPNSEE